MEKKQALCAADKAHAKANLTSRIINIASVIGLLGCIAFIIYGFASGIFSSQEAITEFMAGFGIWAPVVFVFIQAVQVVVPILPGAIGCVGGVVFFGPWLGFVYNYTGICIGSILAFLIARRYGTPVVKSIVKEKAYDKYIGWTERGHKFDKMFAVAIFLPVAPDDLLCYLAGLTKMSLKKFTLIILLGKPVSIAVYSMSMAMVGKWLYNLFT